MGTGSKGGWGAFAGCAGLLSVLKKCHDPNKYNERSCLIITPESAHAILLVKMHQTHKHPNDGYP